MQIFRKHNISIRCSYPRLGVTGLMVSLLLVVSENEIWNNNKCRTVRRNEPASQCDITSSDRRGDKAELKERRRQYRQQATPAQKRARNQAAHRRRANRWRSEKQLVNKWPLTRLSRLSQTLD
jgi:hypothetical protein